MKLFGFNLTGGTYFLAIAMGIVLIVGVIIDLFAPESIIQRGLSP